jgi:hypothetical protein
MIVFHVEADGVHKQWPTEVTEWLAVSVESNCSCSAEQHVASSWVTIEPVRTKQFSYMCHAKGN